MCKYNMKELTKITVETLERRGVTLEDIGRLVLHLQSDYYDDLTLDICVENIKAVLNKRKLFMLF